MKRADRDSAWRRVGPEWKGPGPRRLALIALSGFRPVERQLYGGLTVFCGSNAAGKTRLLAAIAEDHLIGEASRLELQGDVEDLAPVVIDTFWLIQKQRMSLGHDEIVQERVAQAGFSRLRAEDQRVASYLLGRDYEVVEVAEIEATDDDALLLDMAPPDTFIRAALDYRSEVIPYFRVTRGDATYSTESLSQGELAGLTLLWALRSLDKGNVALIDEPESFLSPRASQRALDVIAHYASQRRSPCIVTSHSYLGLAAMPKEHLVLLEPVPGENTVALVDGTEQALWSVLRIQAPKSIVFVVEDEAAGQWLRYLLHQLEYEHLDLVDVWVAGGADAVRNAASFPDASRGSRLSVWGVLDGDERQKSGKASKLLFLPGFSSPERLMLTAINTPSITVKHFDQAAAQRSLTVTEGDDIHDRMQSVASDCGMPIAVLRHVLLWAWLNQTKEGLETSEELKQQLSAVVPPGGGALAP